jgi:phosphocarrier protein HPr
MKEFSYVITDSEGIHARPAGLLVKEAAKFQSDIKLKKGEKEADAKRIFGVMGLGVKTGEEVTITADGADEDAAIAELEAFFKENL